MSTAPAVTIETITPAKAAEYLDLNTNNRAVRPARVAMYANAIREGRWQLTGEPITFNGTSLVNGQHRLKACIEAGTPFTTVVVRGVSNEAYDYIDSGLGRSASDVVQHAGVKNAVTAAAAARLVIGFETGVIHTGSQLASIAHRAAVKAEVLESIDEYDVSCQIAKKANATVGMNASALAAFRILALRRASHEKVTEFLDGAISGADLEAGDARLTLRNQMLGPHRPRDGVGNLALLIRAWNAWVSGSPTSAHQGVVSRHALPEVRE